MKIGILGSGMYVTGRGQNTHGTILASIFQFSKESEIDSISVICRSHASDEEIVKSQEFLNQKLDTSLAINTIYLEKDNTQSFRKILETEKFDAVIISVPDHFHYVYAKISLLTKTPCLVVKPFVTKHEEAKELCKLVKEQNTYGAVEFHKRWDDTNLYTKKIIQEGKLGQLVYMHVDYSQRISIPLETFKTWAESSNIFQYLGVHYVDLFYFFTSYTPKKVLAIGTNGILKQKGLNTFDSVHVDIIWENPENKNETILTRYDTNWIDPDNTTAMSDQRFKIIGTEGRLDLNQKNRGIEEVTNSHGVASVNPYFSEFLPDKNGNLTFQGYGHESIRTFMLDIIALQNKEITVDELTLKRPSFEQSTPSTAVVEAVNKSLGNGFQWVDIEQ